MWKVEYYNDTGPHDEFFMEWWEITDGTITYSASSEEEAQMLCDQLNVTGLVKRRAE